MRPKLLDFDPANANLTGFASNVTGATWTLTANESGDGLAHQVSIRNDSATDHSGKTATLVGTDADGRAQTETIALPAGSATVESTKYFLTLTSVTPSATIGADTMDIGWVDEFASQTIPLDSYRENAPTIGINVTGTISLDVQLTNDDVFAHNKEYTPAALVKADQEAYLWLDDATLAAVTADAHAALGIWPVRAMRIIANSYTSGAEAQVTLTQSW